MGLFGILLRFPIYLAVAGGCSATLYGIVTQQRKAPGSVCLLFPSSTSSGGNKGYCKYIEFSAAAQLALAVIMAAVAIVRVVKKKTDTTSALSFIEMFFVIPAFIVALSGGIIVHLGLGKMCSDFKEAYEKGSSAPWPGCKTAFDLAHKVGNFPNYYQYLYVAEIGMWLTCAWIFHVVLSIVGSYLYFRRDKGSMSIQSQSDFTASSEKYQRMHEPI